MASVLAAGIAALGFFSAGGFDSPAEAAPSFPDSVSAPAGYQVTYAHDFSTQGMGDWVTQPRAGATVSVSSSYGLGVGLTGEDQWAEVISSDAVIGPNSFVQGLVYIPPGRTAPPLTGPRSGRRARRGRTTAKSTCWRGRKAAPASRRITGNAAT